MRKVIGFFDIIIFALALTVFTFIMIMSNSILSVKYLNKVIKDEGIYRTINDEVKNNIKSSIGSTLSNYPGVVLNTSEMIDYVLTEDVLEKEFTYVVDNLFKTGKLVVDPTILTKGYRENFSNYLKSKNINIPDKLQNEITDLMANNSEGEIEVKEFNENFSDYFITLRNYVSNIKMISISIVIILFALTMILAKEKIKLVYKPLILASINLFAIGASTTLIDTLMKNTSSIPIELEKIILSIKNHLFGEFIKYGIIFVVIAIILIIVRIVLKRKKQSVNNDTQNTLPEQSNQQQPVQSTVPQQVENSPEQIQPVENVEQQPTEINQGQQLVDNNQTTEIQQVQQQNVE